MTKLVIRPKSIAQQMLDEKKEVERYFHDSNANPKPVGVKFIKPFALPASGK